MGRWKVSKSLVSSIGGPEEITEESEETVPPIDKEISYRTLATVMSGYANAAKKMVPNIPAGGGGFFLAAVGLATGAYGLYHSVVTGTGQ